ncbi:hypothetical protein FJZ41_01990 [Candidatus Shapirobacteria bacterium]|nr:hypothetical protein [Candidatus Shapirobacteria bacterium]
MINSKEIPHGHGSHFIKFAEENFKKYQHDQKREQRRINKKLNGKNNHQDNWPQVNPQSFYLVRCFYFNGEPKIIQGENFAEKIKPKNVKKLSQPQFEKALDKLIGNISEDI